MNDAQFFASYPDRRARIRLPVRVLARTRQRAVFFHDECEAEFLSLGGHDKARRRILVWRKEERLLQIPFLAYADDTIEDTDEVLIPLIHEVMLNAAKKLGAR